MYKHTVLQCVIAEFLNKIKVNLQRFWLNVQTNVKCEDVLGL